MGFKAPTYNWGAPHCIVNIYIYYIVNIYIDSQYDITMVDIPGYLMGIYKRTFFGGHQWV
jgi:hypothetical protein